MLQSLNQWYGFWGAMGNKAEAAWALAQAIGAAITEWRGYRVGKATRRAYGMPEGADYLTGMVLAAQGWGPLL